LPMAQGGSGMGMTLWLVSMAIFIASSLLGSLNYIVTVINLRTKGMSMTRLPLTIWAFLVTAIIGVVSFPVLLSAALLFPGMITQFGFTPTVTTSEMRQTPEMIEKVANINKIRVANSKALIEKGEEPLDSYEFDYLLLCNKICGKSHYNMQMKIIVETQEEYEAWIKEQKLFKNSLVQN